MRKIIEKDATLLKKSVANLRQKIVLWHLIDNGIYNL